MAVYVGTGDVSWGVMMMLCGGAHKVCLCLLNGLAQPNKNVPVASGTRNA